MAQARATKKPAKPKLSRAERKQNRRAGRQKFRDSLGQIRQAFSLTRKIDNKLIPFMLLGFIVPAAVIYVVFLLVTGSVWLPIAPAVVLGVLGGMFLFSRRAQDASYTQAEGQPGVAAEVLKRLRGDWRKTDAVAATAQFDVVHRILGRPGVVLVGEGAPSRVKPLLAQEKKRIARVAGDAPIYDIVVGRGEGEVPLKKLNVHVMRLPRNLSKEQVVALDRRLSALNVARAPLPQGPMPSGVRMRNVQRSMRRRG